MPGQIGCWRIPAPSPTSLRPVSNSASEPRPLDANTLSRAIEILENDPEIYLPVERLWLTLRTEGLAMDLDRESLQRELQADSHFELTAPPVLLSDEAGARPRLAAGPP